MNAKYNRHLETIPLYLAGRMDTSHRADFEAFASSHPDFQKEVDDIRPAFAWLDHEFDVAGDTKFRLSPARRAELRRASRSNVVAFPEDGGRDQQRRKIGIGGIHGKVLKWATAAALLVSISYLGLAVGRDATQERIAAVLPVAQTASQPADPIYVYPPAYGLNRPELWRLANHSVDLETVSASLIEQEIRIPEWQPEAYGLDGPRPYYKLSTMPGIGAI